MASIRYHRRMIARLAASAFAVSLATLAGCSCSTSTLDGPCDVNGDCDRGQVCLDDRCQLATDGAIGDGGGFDVPAIDALPGTDTPLDGMCGGGEVPITLNPPAVLVVIDRSCSMRRTVTDGEFGTGPEDPTTRWNIAREAVRRLTERFPTRVRWGLLAFPGALEGCGAVPAAQVPPASGTAAAVYAALLTSDVEPFHWCDMGDIQPHQTPTDEALEAALALPELNDAGRERFVILLTDGAASCGADDASMTDVGTRLAAAGIRTAAIGFGSETTSGAAATNLEALAIAGGLPNPAAPPSYYLASDGASLDSVLDAIVLPSISCTITLDSVPPDPSELHVFANDVELTRDAPDGWSYDPVSNTITLEGGACEDLRRAVITRLSVAYGCAIPTCTPHDESCNGLDDDCDDSVDEECLD
jgi:hypothetical protein